MNLLNTDNYDAQQTLIDIIKTYREVTTAAFNAYPDALRLFAGFARRTVVTKLNETLLQLEERQTVHIPISSEGAVNAMATGPTAEVETAAIVLRFYKNQFDIDEDVIEVPKAAARVRLFMLATVFAVELQSPLEIFRALRGAPHSLEAGPKRQYWMNMIRQVGAGMLRDANDTEGEARILALRSLLETADRDFGNLPRDQLFGLIVDWKTALSIGMNAPINNQDDLLKLANPGLFKGPVSRKVGDVLVDSIPPYYQEQIQQETTLTMDHPLVMSFAAFLPIKDNASFKGKAIRVYFPDYQGGARFIRVTTDHNLLIVIKKAVITGSSHIVVFGKEEPAALAESAETRVRGGDGNSRDARNGMAYVQASRYVGATCTRPNNVVEFLSRNVRSIEVDLTDGKDEKALKKAIGADLTGESNNIFVIELDENLLPIKDVFDLLNLNENPNAVYSRDIKLFDKARSDKYWTGESINVQEEHPLGYALSMPAAVTLDQPFLTVGPNLAASSNAWSFAPCHGPGLTLSRGVNRDYQGTYIITPPDVNDLIQLYTSAYSLEVV